MIVPVKRTGRPWVNSVATGIPAIAGQVFGWDPSTVGEGSNIQYPWFCEECGLVWPASPTLRKRNPVCPGCTNRALVVGLNDLATCNPALAAQATGWDTTAVRFNEYVVRE